MSGMGPIELHARADDAAARGDFVEALACAADALSANPLDHRARLKVGLCFVALERVDLGVRTLIATATDLHRRGLVLQAIGACRDASEFAPGDALVREAMMAIHRTIHGLEGRSRTRVPPPAPPSTLPPLETGSFSRRRATAEIIHTVAELATRDPSVSIAAVEPVAVPLFSDLSSDSFVSIVEGLAHLKVPRGHVVFREGDIGRSLYILVDGEVSVSRSQKGDALVARLGSGSLFGEMSLVTSKPRSATVATTEPSELFELSLERIDAVARAQPAVARELAEFARRRLIMNALATSPIFARFEDGERVEILRAFRTKLARASETIIEEDREPDGLYVVLEGEVDVVKRDASGETVVLNRLREGDVFGEIALLRGHRTTATVVAPEKCSLLFLRRDRFEAFVAEHPKIREFLSTLTAERMEKTARAMAPDEACLEADDLILV